MVNPLESVRVGKNLVERPALNGDHNFLQKIHEHQFDAQDKALATSGVRDCNHARSHAPEWRKKSDKTFLKH